MAVTGGDPEFGLLAFLPSAPALLVSFDVSHELIGRAWYAFRALVSRMT